jgi:hypothetical protein
MLGRETRHDYALLKSKLPPLSQLKFDQWCRLRHRGERST